MDITLIMGLQGSGKSTVAKKLEKEHGFIIICAGDLLRQHIKDETELGKTYKESYDKGLMAPSELTCAIMDEDISGWKDTNQHIILDGFPRDGIQLKWLEDNYTVNKCLFMDISEEIAIKRLLERGRSDDTEESIKKRFSIYKEKTFPIVDHYREIGTLIIVNSSQDPWATYHEVLDKLRITTIGF